MLVGGDELWKIFCFSSYLLNYATPSLYLSELFLWASLEMMLMSLMRMNQNSEVVGPENKTLKKLKKKKLTGADILHRAERNCRVCWWFSVGQFTMKHLSHKYSHLIHCEYKNIDYSSFKSENELTNNVLVYGFGDCNSFQVSWFKCKITASVNESKSFFDIWPSV